MFGSERRRLRGRLSQDVDRRMRGLRRTGYGWVELLAKLGDHGCRSSSGGGRVEEEHVDE